MSSDPALSSVPPDGSLGLLAFGYRGLVAWRAARGTAWIQEERERYETAQRVREEAAKKKGTPSRKPTPDLGGYRLVIVSGLPRSGTSMLMQMLEAGGLDPFVDGEREADVSNPRGYYEHDRIRALARDKGWVLEADGKVAKVVAPLLPHLPAGPEYRVVLLTRAIDEVLRSQRQMLARLDRPATDDNVLRPAYARHLAAARRWVNATPGAELLELDHADVIADPSAAADQLAAFLDASLDLDAMAQAVDPSLHRERTASPHA